MNLPNKITIFRVCMIPVFLVFYLADSIPFHNVIALAVFIIACLSDALDGHLARKNNLVTNFGKFMDPLADKLLVSAALIALTELHRIPGWIVIIIISREFVISGFRLIAAEKGVVIAAGYIGKFKTTFQMIMVCLMIGNIEQLWLVTDLVMYIALALTIISLIDYLIRNKDVMKDEVS